MPGANCSIYGCGSNRRHKGLSIFKVPGSNVKEHEDWRAKLLGKILKDREIDEPLKQRIESGSIYICEKHFTEDCIETYDSTSRKTLKPGSIPTLQMPIKSHTTEKVPRRELKRINLESTSKKCFVYDSFKSLLARVKGLKLEGWNLECKEDRVILQKQEPDCFIPKFELCVDDSLGYYIQVYGWLLPEDHPLYTVNHRSMRHITLSNLVADIDGYRICTGLSIKIASQHTVNHVVPRKFDPLSIEQDIQYRSSEYCRSINCLLVCPTEKCEHCIEGDDYGIKVTRDNKRRLSIPSKLNAPVSKTHPERLKQSMQEQRLKCSKLESEIERMRSELAANSVSIENEMNNDFLSIIDNGYTEMTPFMQLFWQEQKRLFSYSKRGQRYHPMIIRFCLSLHSKSPAAYEEVRDALGRKQGGILTLPCKRTLRDYKNWIRPKCGFNEDVILDLVGITDKYFGVQRYVVLLLDEMKIRANLVYDKVSDELIGFVDLGDPHLNFGVLEKVDQLATYALMFMVRGLATDLCFNLAYFATKGAVSYEIFAVFWEAVAILELNNIWVIATTCDGASANRSFIKMHKEPGSQSNVTFFTVNFYAPERNIYFFSDAPHLVKTARNCLYHSGSGTCTRYMWNDGKYLLWQHIFQLYQEDKKNGLQLLPRIRSDHIKLTSYSV
ncbi:uncharacterized protein LOC135694124 [Rhopilema esculentum]|uniref:uncharacterized protein LOC135694124 n=1 Tax=Rhopilema esculentum TaxID=499914 RepID=UPI0031CF2AD0